MHAPDDPAAWVEFTEAGYAAHIERAAKSGYAFARFDAPAPAGPHVLWRHDIDMSPQRAAKLAAIEAYVGVTATYFVNPRSDFYGINEEATAGALSSILGAGHALGLHFDLLAGSQTWSATALDERVAFDAELLAHALGAAPSAISLHNPDAVPQALRTAPKICGLSNAYGSQFADYAYVSDSNGYWRFKTLADMLDPAANPKLHVLTHPEWWTPTPMSPRDRVRRAAQGRADAALARYDAILSRFGRRNIGG